ncbi:MAG: hypothetical protein ACKPKO_51285, partial [Candidatus Fonsibacter sp.]
LVAGAMEWFEECVANCGSLNVLIISDVGSPMLSEVFSSLLLGVGGLMGATGVICDNLVSTDSRGGSVHPFMAKHLTHSVDDQIDVLTSIRASCWASI